MITKREPEITSQYLVNTAIEKGLKCGDRMDFISKKRSFSVYFDNLALINALISLSGPDSGLDGNKALNLCLSAYMEHLQESLPDKLLDKLAEAYRVEYQALVTENLPGLYEGFDRLGGGSKNG
jgi:hypothetical protein